MSDATLRELERTYRATGAPEDALLIAKVRAGHVTDKDARTALANALRGRFLKLMARYRGVPLGPFTGNEHERLTGLTLNSSPLLAMAMNPSRSLSNTSNGAFYEGSEWLWVILSERPNGGSAARLKVGDVFQVEVESYVHVLQAHRTAKQFTTVVESLSPWRVRVLPPENYTMHWRLNPDPIGFGISSVGRGTVTEEGEVDLGSGPDNYVALEPGYWTPQELAYRDRMDHWNPED